MLNKLKTFWKRMFIPLQGTHELLKNPVTIPEADLPLSSSSNPYPAPSSIKPWVQEIKDSKKH